jgi:hypothetical protein
MALYDNNSPYAKTDYSAGYLDVQVFRDIPQSVDDVLFTVGKEYENRPDLLAYDLYQTSSLWWVFSVRNKNILRDPVFDMVAGIKIYVPTQATITSALGN